MAVAPDRSLEPAHLFERFIHRMVARVMHGLLGAPDGNGRFARDFHGAFQGCFYRFFVGVKHGIEQAIAQRFVGAHAPSGVGQFFDYRQRHQLGQALQSTHIGHHADIDFLDAEKSVFTSVANTASRHHVHRAADDAAVQGCYHRNAQCL